MDSLSGEDRRTRSQGGPGCHIGKLVICERERAGRTTLILVDNVPGF